ncbi:sialidase family protein [Bdellovibrio sp. 22V]|uniref:WD40/YVTN/BNR-like repeat-containing protein n=1 Tax=Bdellovibrio TaxID=958 RepID=UPI002542F74C|nr:sialidase family protein [Bdellovibrio sp. 22V]WII71668.1 sialidase family protein [Bdellovibrio sp. 22V]
MIQSISCAFQGLVLFMIVLLSSGCTIEAFLEKEALSLKEEAIPLSIIMDVGSTKKLEPLGGTPPFSYKPATSGYLDTSAGEYSIPVNAPLENETVEITDSTGKTFAVTIRRKGFAPFMKVEMPQVTEMDQNYVSDAVWLSSGHVLATAIGSDYMGERWATYRSADDGATWSRVDQFMGFSYLGESHPLSMVAKGSMVFVCGYAYLYDTTPSDPNSGWFVRRSTDEGTTWTTVDAWWEPPLGDHVCYDIAVSPVTGFIYAVGYADSGLGSDWIVRESRDDGMTWQTIYRGVPGGGSYALAYQIEISPSGQLFIMGETNTMYFLRGEENAGVWSWTPATSIPAVTPYGDYQLRGSLKVVSNTTAFYSCRVSSSGKIYRTTDAGVTWSEVYSGQSFLQGMTLTSSGSLVAVGGNRVSSTADWKVVRSADSGATWNVVDLDVQFGSTNKPYGLSIASHPTSSKVLAFSYNHVGDQSTSAFSADDGVNWSERGKVRFYWAFWSSLTKIIRASSTTLYAVFDTGDEEGGWPWLIMKSLDNGVSWQEADRFKLPSGQTYVHDFIQGHDGGLYAVGIKGADRLIRRSPDGVTWTDVLYAGAGYSDKMLLAKRGNTETIFAYDDGLTIRIHKSTDGVTWSEVTALTTPGGIDDITLKSVLVDDIGNLYVELRERTGGNGRCVVHQSRDGGVTWTESFRGAFVGDYYSFNSALRQSPSGEIFVSDGGGLFVSTDHGVSWSSSSNAPSSSIKDIAWIDNEIYFMVADTAHKTAVVKAGEASGAWVVMESSQQRRLVGETVDEYDVELHEDKFIYLGPSDILLNYTYNDPYLGARAMLRSLTTSSH